jgi:hypothetical protein
MLKDHSFVPGSNDSIEFARATPQTIMNIPIATAVTLFNLWNLFLLGR